MSDAPDHTTRETEQSVGNANRDADLDQTAPTLVRPAAPRWLITTLVVALVAGMAIYLFTQLDGLDSVRRLSTIALLLTLASQVLSQLLWNAATLFPLQTHVRTLGFWELFMLRMSGFIVAIAVPVAGSFALRMAYLKRRGVTYADFTWATLVSNVLGILAGVALTVVAVIVLFVTAGTLPVAALSLTAALVALSIGGLVLTRVLPRLGTHAWLRRWPWLTAATSGFQTDSRTTIAVLICSFLRHSLNFFAFGVLYQSLSDASSGFLVGGLVYAFTMPIRLVALTPGNNLGLNEWIIAIVGKTLSFDVATGLLVGLLYRGVTIASQVVSVLVGGAWLTVRGESWP